MGAYGFDSMMPELAKWEPRFKNYAEFEKVMEGLVNLFGECPSCVDDGGDPDCTVRKCCRQKGHVTCVNCTGMDTCEELRQRERAFKRLKEIKAMGTENWVEEMQRKTNAGYCYLDEKSE